MVNTSKGFGYLYMHIYMYMCVCEYMHIQYILYVIRMCGYIYP